jgi:hypothetical protein
MSNELSFIVDSQFDTLDKVANKLEVMLLECGLPGRVRGGIIRRGCVQMVVSWQCDPIQYYKCSQLNAAILCIFGCHGGIDVHTHDIYLQANKPLYGAA